MNKNSARLIVWVFCILLIISGFVVAADKRHPAPVKHEANIIKQDSAKVTGAAPATGEEINWQVLSGGGGPGVSTNFMLRGTLGQTAVGSGGSANFIAYHGYWQNFGAGGGPMCGDPNADEAINIGDIVFLVNYIFKEGPPSDPLCISDTNGDGPINIGDAVHLVNYIFKEGPPPDPNCCP
jgi:hypothetical protein